MSTSHSSPELIKLRVKQNGKLRSQDMSPGVSIARLRKTDLESACSSNGRENPLANQAEALTQQQGELGSILIGGLLKPNHLLSHSTLLCSITCDLPSSLASTEAQLTQLAAISSARLPLSHSLHQGSHLKAK